MKTIYYLNLTNGLEMINQYPNPHFIRIQSSHIEAKAYDTLFMQLDSDFLMNLALGNRCVVIDASQKDRLPKSIRVGIPIIEYVLNKNWFNTEISCVSLKGTGKTIVIHEGYLNVVYNSLKSATKAKLRYFKKFLFTDEVIIEYKSHVTKNDGNYVFFKELMKNAFR